MKNKELSIVTAVLSAALTGTLSSREEAPQSPIGTISSRQAHVVSGANADLDWQISYPVHSFNQTDSEVKVRFITCAIGPRWRIQFGTRLEGGSYNEFYHGFSEEHPSYSLTPGTVVSRTFLSAGEEIEFLVKHERSQVPGKWVSSADPSLEHLIIELKNGDAVPDVAPVSGQRSVADILAPYSEDGKITIGDNEKILLFELFTTDVEHFGFDLQDLVLLVSHEQVELDS